MTKKELAKIEDLVHNSLSLLEIDSQFREIKSEDDLVLVQLNLPETESGVFIGHQGETLASLQLIIGLIVAQRLGRWIKIKLNVGDYQQRREQNLFAKVDQAAQRALNGGQEIILPNLNSYERHLVHEYLSNRTDVYTESRGDQPHRQLYVIPKLV